MDYDPYELIDRFKADDDNDDREALKVGTAIARAEGRTPPISRGGRADQNAIAQDVKRFQSRHGLKVDGIVKPQGPTIQRAAAIAQAKKPRPAWQRSIGRGANMPLYGSVGPGQSNLPTDVASLRAGMRLLRPNNSNKDLKKLIPTLFGPDASPTFLMGGKEVKESHRPFEPVDPKRPSIDQDIRALQGKHGLKEDGIVEPFGPTHDLMDSLLAPRLNRLVGDDIDNPLPFQPQEPRMVARTLSFRPSTVRTFWQDRESMDDEDDHEAATFLRGITRNERAMMAAHDAGESLEPQNLSTASAGNGGSSSSESGSSTGDTGPADGARGEAAGEVGSDNEAKDTSDPSGTNEKSAEDIRQNLVERYGGEDADDPWVQGAEESFDDHINRLRSVIHHAPDSETRNAAVRAAQATLPQDPAERLAAEQGVSRDAWLSATDAPTEAQKIYQEWLNKPADKRPPLPDTFAMVYFAGPDGQLYLRKGAETDDVGLSNIRRVDALEQDVARRNSDATSSYEDQFRIAAQSQMEQRPNLKGVDGRTGPLDINNPADLGRRSRLETFHRNGPAISAEAANKAMVDGATRWVGKVVDRLNKAKGRTTNESSRVGTMSPEVVAFIKSKGVEAPGNGIHIADTKVQRLIRDAKRDANIALPEQTVRDLPKHLDKPEAVLWQKTKEDTDPTLLYVFDVPDEPRRGKLVVRINFRLQEADGKSYRNAVISGGLVATESLRNKGAYERISGSLE